VTLGIRANHMRITNDSEGDLVLQVNSTEQLGGETYVYGNVDEETKLTLHLAGQVDVQAGQRIGVVMNKHETHLFDKGSGMSLRR